ncbi:LGFP repeat-containing protein [Nocardia sp. NPDC050175]|uniref:LGFP repeat-containing protein n=1 Tax=Nocardia sp. NPDC050175 TaxID=3364317 RepID=UPI0037902549
MPEMLDTHRGKTRRRTSLTVGAVALLASGLLATAPSAVADPSAEATNAIDAHYADFGGAGSFLGAPLGPATDVAGGAERAYQGGVIYFSPNTGAKAVYGEILVKYKSLGGPSGPLSFPTNDETGAGDAVGRFNDFAEPGGAAIYWKPETGAWAIKGKVLDAWRESGGITGPFGYPRSDMTVDNGVATANFEGPGGTEIKWSDSEGLATLPPELAATLPGFRVGSPDVAAPNPDVAVTNDSGNSGINRWWGIPIGLAITAVVGGLLGMLGRRRADPTPVTTRTTRGPAARTSAATTTGDRQGFVPPRTDATAAATAAGAAPRGTSNVAGAHEMHRDAPRTRG